MSDLLNLIVTASDSPSDDELHHAVSAHISDVRKSARAYSRDVVHQVEQTLSANPSDYFQYDSNQCAILNVDGHQWAAGNFETLSVGELKARAQKKRSQGKTSRTRLFVLDGASPATDIGTLQCTSSEGTLFQVASQFNCLESPGPFITSVSKYFHDQTQGPRASISAFPGTLLRHYQAPRTDGMKFTQQEGTNQIDLLSNVCSTKLSQNGYFSGEGISNAEAVAAALESNFNEICVGVHNNVQVVRGYDWDGHVDNSETKLIAQVFTSTAAGGCYGAEEALGRTAFPRVCRQLLRAAYLGTLLAAICSERNRVVLTLIGGGVFSNPLGLIWDSIEWALDEVMPFLPWELDVFVNGYNLGQSVNLEEEILPAVRNRKGFIVVIKESVVSKVLR
jgi:hypothetical protein